MSGPERINTRQNNEDLMQSMEDESYDFNNDSDSLDSLDSLSSEESLPTHPSRGSRASDTFGNQEHNITRDEILKLFHKVDGQNKPNEKELLNVLRDALRSASRHDSESAWEAYQTVSDQVPEEIAPEISEDANTESEITNPTPNRVQNGANIFDSLSVHDYKFTTKYSDSVHTNNITVNGGTIKLNGMSATDTVNVIKNSTNNYQIIFHKNGSSSPADTITYNVTGSPTRILINALAQNITGVPEDDSVLQAGAGTSVAWPSSSGDLTSKVPVGGEGANEARTLLEKITTAVSSNNSSSWTEATNYLNGLWPSQSTNHNPSIIGGPALRKALTAIYAYVGNNDNKFKQIMMKLDPHLRAEMIRCMHTFTTGTNVYRMGTTPDPATPDRSYGQGTMQDGDAKSNEGFENLLGQVPQTQLPNTPETDNTLDE